VSPFQTSFRYEVLRVARTVADLDQSDPIRPNRLYEAINYRTLDRNLWT
jgi:magnesium chelatase family protein